VALARAAAALDTADWLVVASARAVSALFAARGGRPLPAHLRTAAVGESTAAALRSAGAAAVFTATRAGAAALLAALRGADDWRARRVLLPRAADGGRELGEGLRTLGAQVDEVAAYRTVPRPAEELAADWRRARPEAVVIASPSAARALVAALGRAALAELRAVVAIGATTRAALQELGIAAAVPARTDFEGVAGLLGELLPVKGDAP
ncbi:MAG: uroporphyrinogen-III synthase, partial [Candidatus Eisenbacteria bacterium]|nr:uroporphyrinogen-III synthase [Candidatus Eisenbacteria bacterium]